MPFSATHWFLPMACQPFKLRPLNNCTGLPQTGSDLRRNEGARTAVQLYVLPSVYSIVPDKLSPCKVPSNKISLSLCSHCGGTEKFILPSVKFTLETGLALPPPPTYSPM